MARNQSISKIACDNCVSDRSIAFYRKSLNDKIVGHFKEYLNGLPIEELEKMAEKIK